MRAIASPGAKKVGKFNVEFEVANYVDLGMAQRGLLPADKVRRETVTGVVDPGAAMLVLPQSVVKHLGLRLKARRAFATRITGRRSAGRQKEPMWSCSAA